MKKSVVILYFHLLPFFFFAQSVQLESITVADGLSQGFISTILQTEDGFLWIGTLDGLNRYDGHNFKIYTHNPFDPWSLSGDYITELFEDSKGRLWVGTNESGINMLDRRSNRFFHLEYQMENKQRLSLQEIQGVIEDPRGAIWIAPNDNYVIKLTLPKDFPSAFRFSNDSIPKVGIKSFKLTTPDVASKKLNTSHCFNLLTDSTIHMGTEHGLYQVDLQTNRFESVDIPNIPGRSEQGVLDIYKDNSGALWLARPGFLTRIYDGEFRNYAGFGFANVLQSDRNDGHLWISREEQLYRVEPSDLNKKSTSHWPTFYNSPYVIRTMFEDSGGLIWLGTTGVGLRKFDSRKHKFQHYLQDQSIYSMMEDDAGQLWLRYDRIDYQKVNFENNLTSKTGFFGNRFAYVFDIILDSSGIFWAWVEEKKNENLFIIKYSKKNGTLQKYAIPLEMRHDFSAKLLEDAHGQIWGAGPAGFFARYDEAADTLIFIKNDTIARRLGENSWVMHFIEDVDGHFWLGTTNGLVKVVPEHIRSGHEPVFQLYQSDPKNKRSPSHYLISTLLDDPVEPHKYLWLGTKGGGLNKMDKHSGEFTHFGLEDGLPNMVVYGILADNQKNLWISTNQGLSQFNPTTGTFKNFSEKNGLQSMEFNTFSYLKLSDGRMAFGGVNGLNVFDPEALSFNAHVPNVVIVGLKVNNKSIEFKPNPSMETDQKKERRILNRAIEQCEFVELSYNQNFLTLEFAAIDFSNPGKNEYRYQLTQSSSFLGGLFQKELDLDSDWIDAGTNHFATFTHLSSGDYLFQVKGSNNEGVWNETPTILRILIHPPWWRSNLAYLMYALTILGTLLAGYRFQINRIKLKNELAFEHKEAERLATLDRLKTDFFSNITHEFRTPLTLIIDPLKQAIKDIRDETVLQKLLLVQRNSDKLLLLINQLLDLNKLESQSMKVALSRGDFVVFAKPIIESFLSLARKKNIQLDFQHSNNIAEFDFDAEKCWKILYNLVGNAMKFMPEGGKVMVDLDFPSGMFSEQNSKNHRITVSDTGIGIPKSELPRIFDRFYQVDGSRTRSGEGTGIGLSITKQLTELMGGAIEVESEEGKGTTFQVILPMIFQAEMATQPPNPLKGESLPALVDLEMASEEMPIELNDSLEVVLIVEDNADIRTYVRQSLPNRVYQLIEAADGLDGLRKATEYTPDLIIIDIMMPVMDGFELLDILKQDHRTSHIPIILLTAKAAMASKLKGLKSGADAYLTKPFSMEELSVRIEKLLEQRLKWQEYFRQNGFQKADANPLPTADQQFLQTAAEIIEEHLADEHFGIDRLCKAVGMSRVTLHRKLKALTNLSTSHFIRSFRLERAYQLLENQTGNVSEVAF